MSKQKLSAEEKSAKKAERKAKFQEMNKKNGTKWQAFKYLCCTASAGLIQIVSFTILQAVLKDSGKTMTFIVDDMDVNTFIATTVALALSILWNFTLNRKFTFKSAKNVPIAMTLAFLFYVPFYPFQTWYVHTVKYAIGGTELAGVVAEATVMLINGILEFCWQKFVIYRKSANTAGGKATPEDALTIETTSYSTAEGLNVEKIENITAEEIEVTENDVIKKD